MKRAAIIIVILIFAIFVWPTFYTYKPAPANPRYLIKTNRVLWALNLERQPKDDRLFSDDRLGVVYSFISGFAMGLAVGGPVGWWLAVERKRRKLARNGD